MSRVLKLFLINIVIRVYDIYRLKIKKKVELIFVVGFVYFSGWENVILHKLFFCLSGLIE